MQGTKVFIDISPENLAKFIEDGVYKSTFAVPAGEKEFRYIEQRRQTEVLQFGYPEAIPQENRPLYGYWSRGLDAPEAAFKQGDFPAMYGSVSLELKAGVQRRSSFSLDDSMTVPRDTSFGEDVLWQVSRADRPNSGSFLYSENAQKSAQFVRALAESGGMDDIARAKTEAFKEGFFIEAQIHGGLIQSDIAKIVVSRGASLPRSVEIWAERNGVAIQYED